MDRIEIENIDYDYRYEKVAKELEVKIRQGIYLAGEKLPSIRDLKKQLNLSISTVYQAYIILEEWGLIEARPKSGYYVKPLKLDKVKPPEKMIHDPVPQVVALDNVVSRIVRSISNQNLLPFGGANISADLLPVKQFAKALKGIDYRKLYRMINYGPPEGNLELRRQISQRAQGKHPIPPGDIVITNGCMEALTLSLLTLTKAGDTVAIEAPAHFGILQLLEELGLMIAEIPTNPEKGLDLTALRTVLDKNTVRACLFTPNFHNPLGTLMPDEYKEELVGLLNERNIPVIEDEIYSELYYDKEPPKPLRMFDKKGLVLSCSSFSKTLSSGFRIGWAIPGKKYFEKMMKLKVGFSISTANIEQDILATFLQNGSYERHLRFLRSSFQRNLMKTALAIQEYFPKSTRLSRPKGGFLLWVELPDSVDGLELYNRALEEKISIVPGIICSNSKVFTHHVRINCGNPFSEKFRAGIQRLGELVYEIDRKKTSAIVKEKYVSGRFTFLEVQKLIPGFLDYKNEYVPEDSALKQLTDLSDQIYIEININPYINEAVQMSAYFCKIIDMLASSRFSHSLKLETDIQGDHCLINVYKNEIPAGTITNRPVKTLEQDLVYLTA